jgi:hypothetical protein
MAEWKEGMIKLKFYHKIKLNKTKSLKQYKNQTERKATMGGDAEED